MKKLTTILFLFCALLVNAQTDSVQHTFIIIGENTSYNQTIPACPYITSLKSEGANFTNFFALSRPSQPNYYNLFAATPAGITSNNDPGAHSKNIPNIYTTLNAKGKTTEGYFEGLPAQGSYIFQSGKYYGKHNGFYALSNVPANVMKPLSALPVNLGTAANVVWIVPDINNDGHDTGVLFFDNWLKTNPQMQGVINYCKNPQNKSRFVITFDEGGSASQQIACVMIGYGVKPNVTINTSYNHYHLFNTLIKPYGASPVNNSVGLPTMTGWELPVSVPVDTTTKKCWKVSEGDSIKTVTTTVTVHWKDSLQVNCDTVVIDTNNYTVLGFYEQFYNQTAVSKTLLDALIRDVNAKKITDLHCYDVRGLSNSQMQAMNTRIKTECPTIRHIIDCTTNGIPHDGFDGVNNEIEPWTVSSNAGQDAEWLNSKALFLPIAGSMKAQKKLAYWHFGWWNTPLMASQCPKYLVDNTSAVMLHYYRVSKTDYSYTKSRLDAIEAAATSEVKFIVYPSYELIFGQNWTGTIDEWFAGYKAWFASQNYKKIKLIGVIGFTRQLYNVKHPVPPANIIQRATNLFRSVENRSPQYQGFDPSKTINSLE